MNGTKKIAFVADNFMEEKFFGGAEKLNYKLLSLLKERGFSIDIYVHEKLSNNYKIPENVYIIESKGYPARDNYEYILSGKAICASDLAYIHGFSYMHRLKCVHNKIERLYYKLFRKKKYQFWLNKFRKRRENLQNTKNVIVSSSVLKNDVVQNYGIDEKKVFIVPPGADVDVYKNIAQINADTTVFGLIAVGFKNKGGYIALKAIRKLRKKHKNFRVKIITSTKNSLINSLIKLYRIEEYVEILPIRDNIEEFYESVDCQIVPSLLDTFSMVAVEGMACGRPAIISRRCGACDLISNDVNGMIFNFDKNPANRLAARMEEYINLSYAKKKEMATNAKNTVLCKTWDKFVENIIVILEKETAKV